MKRNPLAVDCAIAWLEFCRLYPQLDPLNLPTINFNNRLRTTAAQAITEWRHIEVNRKLYDANRQEFARVLIPHEIAHIIDDDLNGATGTTSEDHHRASWQEIMVAFGLNPDPYHRLEIV